MARPLLSLSINTPFQGGQQNLGTWQTNATPPWQQKTNASTVSLFPIPPVLHTGILGATPQFQARPLQSQQPPQLQQQQQQQQQQPTGILGQKPGPSPNNNLQNKVAPWQQSQKSNPPSLLDLPGKSSKFNSSPSNRNQSSSNRIPAKSGNQDQIKDVSQGSQNNLSEPFSKEDLEKKALESEITGEFFDEVKSKNNINQAMNYATQFARTEYNKSKGLSNPNDRPTGTGIHTCASCLMSFGTRSLLNHHYKSAMHNEMEAQCTLRREQAKLILDGKLQKPKVHSSEESLLEAEVEMNLKPKEMDLDPYILGIYESIMRPYWPIPKSQYYCRICNYMEFTSLRELERHNASRDHVRNEENYAEAFCLYCQVHNIRRDLMIKHEKTDKHKETKALMEKAKNLAIKRWHEVNNLDLPENMKLKDGENAKPGDKRCASEPSGDASPIKKVATDKQNLVELTDGAMNDVSAQNTSSKSSDGTNLALADNSKMWFAPITGYVCVACHTIVRDENAQAYHLREAFHAINVAKFKRMLQN